MKPWKPEVWPTLFHLQQLYGNKNHTYHSSGQFQIYNLMLLMIFTKLCNHYFNLILEYFHHSKKNPMSFISCFPFTFISHLNKSGQPFSAFYLYRSFYSGHFIYMKKILFGIFEWISRFIPVCFHTKNIITAFLLLNNTPLYRHSHTWFIPSHWSTNGFFHFLYIASNVAVNICIQDFIKNIFSIFGNT